MRRMVWRGLLVLTVTILLSPSALPTQQRTAEKLPNESAEKNEARLQPTYRVEFTIRELESGKRTNARSYIIMVNRDEVAKVRVGSRVPFNAGEKPIQYQDTGINIDCSVLGTGRESDVVLLVKFESSSVAPDQAAKEPNPIFRQVIGETKSVLVLGKPTVILVVDDVASPRRFEIEVTVTKTR